jgi:hypothetical protein
MNDSQGSSNSGDSLQDTFTGTHWWMVAATQTGDSNYNSTNAGFYFVSVQAPSISGFSSTASTTTLGQVTFSFTLTDGNTYSGGGVSRFAITGPGVNYAGNGTGAQSITLTGLPVGTNTYQLTVVDPLGFSSTTTHSVTVPKIAQTVYISPSSVTVAAGQAMTFWAEGGNAGYTWGGVASGSGPSQPVTFNSAGTYTVTVNDPGNSQYQPSNTATATVTVLSTAPPAGGSSTLLSTEIFSSSGKNSQGYTVPAGANYVVVKAWGAGGAGYDQGGNGALATAFFNAVGGDQYSISVGQGGGVNAGGWPGGGSGGYSGGYGGGGYTSVFGPRGRLWAGGGGGTYTWGLGGNAGTPNAANTYSGGGGTTTSAGSAPTDGSGGTAGSFLQGGSGATTTYGGGGGGGYYGGAGGYIGGGGSSFATDSAYNANYQVGGTSDLNYPGGSIAVGGTYPNYPGGNGAVVILAYGSTTNGAFTAQTFQYASSAQTYTIPAGAGYVVVKAWGAGGGGGGGNGGAGTSPAKS